MATVAREASKKPVALFQCPRMSPIAGLVTGLLYSFPAYKFLGQKQMFLLPLHYGLKLTAWTCRFHEGSTKTKLTIKNKKGKVDCFLHCFYQRLKANHEAYRGQ